MMMKYSTSSNWLCGRNGILILSLFLLVEWGLLNQWNGGRRLPFHLLSGPLRAPKPFSSFTASRNLLNGDVPVDLVPSGTDQDSSEIYDEPTDSSKSWKLTIDDRIHRVREGCDKYGRVLKKFNNHKRLLFDTKHHIAYCKNAKAGTTTWLSELLEGAGFNTTGLTSEEIHEEAKRVFPPLHPNEAAIEMDRLSVLFMVVRHPFTRLVSAYRDKIPEKYRLDLQQKMIDEYRTGTDDEQSAKPLQNQLDEELTEDPSLLPTFREFALFVSNQILSCKTNVVNNACLEQVDVHWRPIYDRCAPCDFHYTVISKVETFYEDQRYIKELANLSQTSEIKESNLLHSHDGPSSAELTRSYFASLDETEKQRVYQAYFFDFYLFGYSPDI